MSKIYFVIEYFKITLSNKRAMIFEFLLSPRNGNNADPARGDVEPIFNSYNPKPIKNYPVEMTIKLNNEMPIFSREYVNVLPSRRSRKNKSINSFEMESSQFQRLNLASPVVVVRKKDGSSRIYVDLL